VDVQAIRILVDQFGDLGSRISAMAKTVDAMEAITATTASILDTAEAVAISRGCDGKFETLAPTNELPPKVDAIQYELLSGPCVDAALQSTVFRTGDLENDDRWPEFGKRAAQEYDVHSMLAVRLFIEDSDDVIAGLNCYSTARDAFSERDQACAELIAIYSAAAVTAVTEAERSRNLRVALESNRQIGVALGILMGRYKITDDEAFSLMQMASQRTHRKLRDIAADVAQTGDLNLP